MSTPKPASPASTSQPELFDKGLSPAREIAGTHTEELVIALCGPIGSPLHEVASALSTLLKSSFGYETCKILRLSEFIEQHAGRVQVQIPAQKGFERISAQIDAGNALRKIHGGSVLAELAINEIRVGRQEFKNARGETAHKTRRVCHIIDSIKNQEEMDLLRVVYREMVYFLGVLVPLDAREGNLRDKGLLPGQIHSLIDRDSGEETSVGQTVRDTYPQCDFFLRIDSDTSSQLSKRVERFVSLVLGTRIVTPHSHEAAMYAAAAAASGSACLSRQVGAAITDAEGNLISVGWNDVPKYGGGLYESKPSDPNGEEDRRCWNRDGGKCFNDEEKHLLADLLIESLGDSLKDYQKGVARIRIGRNSKLKNLIEFSRSVHAEMHAIINSGVSGAPKSAGRKMFVTTYPCHSCARHIVAAGITEVYYIEPYRKSLAVKLHGDALSEKESDTGKVRILAYEGVAPAKYLAFFKMAPDSRKQDGRLIPRSAKKVFPKLEKSLEALPTLEAIVIRSLADKKLISVEGSGAQSNNNPPAA